MAALSFVDHRADPARWAEQLGISREAVEIYLASEVIDLHVDSFIWTRILGYDLARRHGGGPLGGRFYSQVDFPRLLEAAIGGAMWSITTSPFRGAQGRAEAFARNMAHLEALFAAQPAHFAVVRNRREYDAARAAGKHAVMMVVQGGNAVDRDPAALALLADDRLVRVTLVHLSSSRLGTTSFPLRSGRDEGLSTFGKTYVEALDAHRVFVDLAHIGRRSFFDAVEVHDRSLPLIVTHTGVSAVTPSWRNLDDDQLRAIANTGGVIGVIFHGAYTGGTIEGIARHLAHIVHTVGEDHAALGSDFDGAIIPPKGLRSCTDLPRVCDAMLRLGLAPDAVRKILGGNFLRSFQALRG
jgi:membrane dipeptidase